MGKCIHLQIVFVQWNKTIRLFYGEHTPTVIANWATSHIPIRKSQDHVFRKGITEFFVETKTLFGEWKKSE